MPARPTLWRITIGVSNFLVRARIQKELDHFLGSVCGCAVQWRFPARAHVPPKRCCPHAGKRAQIRVGAVFYEEPDHLVTVGFGHVFTQSNNAGVKCGFGCAINEGIGISPRLKQQPDTFHVVEVGDSAENRVATLVRVRE